MARFVRDFGEYRMDTQIWARLRNQIAQTLAHYFLESLRTESSEDFKACATNL